MTKKIKLLFALILTTSSFSLGVAAEPLNLCFKKIEAAWRQAGRQPDFFIGAGQITFDGDGKTRVYSPMGMVVVDGLSCTMNHEEKYPQAAAYALSGVALKLSDGLKRGSLPRKLLYKDKKIEKAVQDAALVCKQIDSAQMEEALSKIELPRLDVQEVSAAAKAE